MRLVSFNAEHGRRADDVVDVDALVEGLVTLAPDIVALQEIDVVDGVDQPAIVAAALEAEHAFAPSAPGGTTGVALIARAGLTDVETIRFLSRRSHVRDWRSRVPLMNADRRTALLARVGVGDHAVSVATAHLHLVRSVSHPQLERVVGALSRRPGPRILAGDLNRRPDWTRSTVSAAGLTLVDTSVPTHPAHRPVRRIDHAAVSGLEVVEVSVVQLSVSDHRALVVDLA